MCLLYCSKANFNLLHRLLRRFSCGAYDLHGHGRTALFSAVIIVVLIINVISTYRLASGQTEEMGRMRIEIIASDMQEKLSEATHSLDRIGANFEQVLIGGADSDEIRSLLSEEKKVEIASTGRTCLNIFCITDAGEALISDMPAPEDYVVQDRIWYQGLMSIPKGKPYISSVYKDAFTDGMCFTVSKILGDGETIIGIDYSMSAIQAYIEKMNSLALMVAVFATVLVISVRERYRAENALRTKEKFLSDLSERLRAPLHNLIELSSSEAMNTEELKPTSESIRLETGQLSNMMDNLFSYSDIVKSEDAARKTEKSEPKDFTIKTQHKFRFLIIVVFLVTMVTTILLSANLHLRWARANMAEEANSYSHQVSSWVLEQHSILGMFVNEVATKPEMVNDYQGMVKWLDSISKHYPGISATYIANPAFDAIHGHPMIMNNGWVPADDYVEEERDWYINALNTSDYSITEPYYDARTGQYCLTFSKAVYTDSGEFVGIFAIDFYLNVLTDIIDSDFTADGYAFLADRTGVSSTTPIPHTSRGTMNLRTSPRTLMRRCTIAKAAPAP